MSQMILTPKISEKAIDLAEKNVYVFEVPASANKIEIKKAVEAAFKINVIDVNLLIQKGKLKRFRNMLGRQGDVKKAYVRIKAGQKITLFEVAK